MYVSAAVLLLYARLQHTHLDSLRLRVCEWSKVAKTIAIGQTRIFTLFKAQKYEMSFELSKLS